MLRYLVTSLRNPGFEPDILPAHSAFLRRLRAQGAVELSGPFTDARGGAYLLRADDLAAATALVRQDPLHTSGASTLTVREWDVR